MTKRTRMALVVLFALVVWILPAGAQSAEVKEKPPMYTYVADWTIPRAQWGEMQKNNAANLPMMQKAFAAGTIVAYGDDVDLLHRTDGDTHDTWWSSMSLAGLLNVLEQSYSSGGATAPVLASATKHHDVIYVSRYYNWHSGSWKDLYTYDAFYKLKPDAPNDAVETISKTIMVPLMEKMLADGTIHEYEIDTEALHTEAPGGFMLIYIAANAEALDKVNAALRESVKSNPLLAPAFGSMVDFSAHRDDLARTNATYK